VHAGASVSLEAPPMSSEVPDPVERSLRVLQDRGIWHLRSTNPPVTSCADAAHHRQRLGYVGIPLCDELKSLLCGYTAAGSARRYVLLHCRGHQRLDLRKVSSIVGAEVTRISLDELASDFGLQYGMVSPLVFIDDERVRQLVDDTVLARFFPPYTLMTNTGDLKHAVEFRPADVFGALPNTDVADIVVEEDKRVPRHTLGILTGNSPESGILLWERINARIRSEKRVHFRGDIGFPRLVIESVPDMGASMELAQREGDVRPVVLDAVERLCETGATVIGLACNTTQYYAEDASRICARYGARFVSLAEETASHLSRSGVTSFDLLGIDPVTDLGKWSDFGRPLRGFDVRVPPSWQVKEITELAFRVKKEVLTPATINRLRDLIHHATETDTVVVALTELSVLLARQKGRPRSGKRFIDTLDLLADAMAELYLEERIATGGA